MRFPKVDKVRDHLGIVHRAENQEDRMCGVVMACENIGTMDHAWLRRARIKDEGEYTEWLRLRPAKRGQVTCLLCLARRES